MRMVLPLLALFMLMLGAGCTNTGERLYATPEPVNLAQAIEQAAAQMLERHPDLTRYSPMIAASFVSIDDLTHSSTLGRIGSELFASELVRHGIQVREVKMRDSLFMEERVGELILSREVQRLTRAHDARAILIGTYAQGQNQLYISVRVVRASDALVLASSNISLPLDNNLRTMLGGRW